MPVCQASSVPKKWSTVTVSCFAGGSWEHSGKSPRRAATFRPDLAHNGGNAGSPLEQFVL